MLGRGQELGAQEAGASLLWLGSIGYHSGMLHAREQGAAGSWGCQERGNSRGCPRLRAPFGKDFVVV